jgi:hypothetical protein
LLGALAKIGRRCIEADRADTTPRDLLLAEHDTLRESIAWGRQQAEAAIRGMNGQNMGGRDLVVNIARPMEARAPRSGGYGGDSGRNRY